MGPRSAPLAVQTLELRLWCSSFGSAPSTIVHPFLHRFELLLLLVVQNGLDLALRILPDRLHFRVTILTGGGLILEERLHLLLAFDQERLDLVLLIGAEAKGARHMFELPVRVHTHGAATWLALCRTLFRRLRGGWCCAVLSDGGAGDAKCERSAKREVEEFVAHRLRIPPLWL